MNHYRITAIVLAIFIALGSVAFAQGRGNGQGRQKGKQQNLEKRIQMYWIWKMTEELDLDEETAAKLFPLVRRYEQQIRETRQQSTQALEAIRQAELSGKVLSKQQILTSVDQMLETEQQILTLRKKQLQEVSEMLDDARFQKFVVLQGQFKKDLRKMINEARGRRGRMGPGGSRGGDLQQSPPPDTP